MIKQRDIEGIAEAWDSRELGADEEFAKLVRLNEQDLNAALDLQPISIRLQKTLVEELKLIAKINGLGYQPLIRQVLTRYVDAEKKHYLREMSRRLTAEQNAELSNDDDSKSACA